ncbi:hypothetical protein H8356DRAFT_1635929 [Neocallimastix lanati (nom. inval.)]|uniref:tRNA-splicing endonuclease subunit Sen15 domain-containing protein n=1 Tax=Neocallimastix californiae TaxID=1754190 RepID=A0A1Y2ESH3_9FUNG|nr:hypothetical protein H8356DRAFT_1635929 [Neocallimastix sp. JGI-2020a]ORY74234.1 hypothetical protein LY90DRAFT_699398 [Neocallimastix californiae]|eukprot:ORY74234.1 hypothetical protein LY90DRAFT_699398 [Neocallimastix californiae]
MENNPVYSDVKEYCEKYPLQAYNIFQTYLDLYIVKKWKVENFIDLELLKTIAFEVRNPKEDSNSIVISMGLNETWSIENLNEIFQDLKNVSSIVCAILSPDSSIVYYRISKGMVPPLKLKNSN